MIFVRSLLCGARQPPSGPALEIVTVPSAFRSDLTLMPVVRSRTSAHGRCVSRGSMDSCDKLFPSRSVRVTVRVPSGFLRDSVVMPVTGSYALAAGRFLGIGGASGRDSSPGAEGFGADRHDSGEGISAPGVAVSSFPASPVRSRFQKVCHR
jgi:hypothetical protein